MTENTHVVETEKNRHLVAVPGLGRRFVNLQLGSLSYGVDAEACFWLSGPETGVGIMEIGRSVKLPGFVQPDCRTPHGMGAAAALSIVLRRVFGLV